MKRLPNNALQKALFEFLKEKQDIPVYDFVPEDAVLPFITIGAINVEDKSTKVDDLTHVTVQIHLWSNYRGRYQINCVAEKLINLLGAEQIDLSEDDFHVSGQGVDVYETYPEENTGYNGVLTLELYIQNLEGSNE